MEEPEMRQRRKYIQAMSARMRQVADFVPPCKVIADVGCDHGYVSIYLLHEKRAEHAIAIEVREGPLLRVEEHCRLAGLTRQMECRLSDGLERIAPGEVDCVIIAGMGGMLMIDILERGNQRGVLPEYMVLQPQSDIDKVRIYLQQLGYGILQEAFINDKEKYYTVMQVRRGYEEPAYTETEAIYGRYLLEDRNPVLYQYLQREYENQEMLEARLKLKLNAAPTDKLRERMKLLEYERMLNRQARAYYKEPPLPNAIMNGAIH